MPAGAELSTECTHIHTRIELGKCANWLGRTQRICRTFEEEAISHQSIEQQCDCLLGVRAIREEEEEKEDHNCLILPACVHSTTMVYHFSLLLANDLVTKLTESM